MLLEFLASLLDDFRDWLQSTAPWIGPLATISGWFFALVTWVDKRRSTAPRIHFSAAKSDDESLAIQMVNSGERVASDVRIKWTPLSDCIMDAVPQPFILLSGQSTQLRFEIDHHSLMVHQFPVDLSDPDGSPRVPPPLGVVQVWYKGNWPWSSLTGFTLTSRRDVFGPLAVTPARLPPEFSSGPRSAITQIKSRVAGNRRGPSHPPPDWDQINEKQIRRAQAILRRRRILNDQCPLPRARLNVMLNERGWLTSVESGTEYPEISATKNYHQTVSFSFRTWGKTVEEALLKALSEAILHDEEYRHESLYKTRHS